MVSHENKKTAAKRGGEHQKKESKTMLFLAIAIIVVGLILVIVAVVSRSIRDNNLEKPEEFHYEGWIDCMPPLSESEEDLCSRAEAAGYPYIAY